MYYSYFFFFLEQRIIVRSCSANISLISYCRRNEEIKCQGPGTLIKSPFKQKWLGYQHKRQKAKILFSAIKGPWMYVLGYPSTCPAYKMLRCPEENHNYSFLSNSLLFLEVYCSLVWSQPEERLTEMFNREQNCCQPFPGGIELPNIFLKL